MKANFTKFIFAALFLLCVTNVTAQDSLSVVLKKAGTLRKTIKKKQVPTLQKLRIEGEINSEDMYFLTTLPQIKELDLRKISLQAKDEKAKENKSKYVTSRNISCIDDNGYKYNSQIEILCLPAIKTLETLVLPNSLIFSVENMHLKKLILEGWYWYDKYNDGIWRDDNRIENMCFDTLEDCLNFCESLKKNFKVDTLVNHYTSPYYFFNEESRVNLFDEGICRERHVSSWVDGLLKRNDKAVYSVDIDIIALSQIEASFLFTTVVPNKDPLKKKILLHWDDSFDISNIFNSDIHIISPYAFINSKYESLRFPDNVTSMKADGLFPNWYSLKEVDLNNITEIRDLTFYGCENIQTVKAKNITSIGHNAFYNCKSLQSINTSNVTFIGDNAFYNCENLTSIVLNSIEDIGSYAFYGTKINNLIIPATIKRISKDAFTGSNIKNIEFLGNTPPEIYEYNSDHEKYNCKRFDDLPENFWRINYTIPKGNCLNYDKGFWYEIKMIEKGSNEQTEYEIYVEKPGEIKSYLTDDIIANAESLKIKGVLYHEDLLALDMCKHLKTLDLSKTFITLNEKDRKRKTSEQAYMISVMLSAFGGMADIADDGYLNQTELIKNFNSIYDDVNIMMLAASPDCNIPEIESNYLGNIGNVPYFKYLEEVRYPIQLNTIKMFGRYVKNVDLPRCATGISSLSSQQNNILLPDSLEWVGGHAFRNCPNIEELIFPSSLKSCSGYAFEGLVSLKKIDLSTTEIQILDCVSHNYYSDPHALPNIEEIYFPESLGVLKGINNLLGEKSVKIYFKSKDMPKGFSGRSVRDIDTVYIPKGCRSGWMDFISNTKATIVEY